MAYAKPMRRSIKKCQGKRDQLQSARLRNLLREAREERSLTQGQLGYLLGKDQTYVAKMEAGNRRIDFSTVEQLAEIFGKSIKDFETLSDVCEEYPELGISEFQRGLQLDVYNSDALGRRGKPR